ncbi:MFS transporter, partial [Yersinia pseudotuberculosis]
IDSNMLLNLPPFVSYIFTATDLPRASLISPIKVKKQALVIHSAPLEKQKEVHKDLDFVETPPIPPTKKKVEAEEESPLF